MLRCKIIVSLLLVFMGVVACQPAKPVFECTDKIGCVTIAPNEPIKIGVMQDTSGVAKATFALEQIHVIELAVEEKDKQLLGHSVELVQTDENCTPEGGANAMLKYIADPQIVAILGPSCSGAATKAVPFLNTSGLTMISGASTGADLTSVGGQVGKDWHAGFFRTSFNNSNQASAFAIFAFKELGLRKAATINDGDAFSVTFQQAFKRAFIELGGQVVLESTTTRGDTDMKPVLTSMAKAQADVILNTLFPEDVILLHQQVTEVKGLETITFFETIVALNDDLLKVVSDQNNPLYLVNTGKVTTPASLEMVKRYEAKYGVQPTSSYYNYGYDAVGLLFKTLEQVAVKEDDGTLHIGRQALRDALYNTKDFEGISGKLTCDKFGDCGVGAFDILQVDSSTASVDAVKTNIVYTYNPQK